ncbi:MAG TPA: YibE/F family protein [bacterium]|nr:YibE/F family protein [bacterium]
MRAALFAVVCLSLLFAVPFVAAADDAEPIIIEYTAEDVILPGTDLPETDADEGEAAPAATYAEAKIIEIISESKPDLSSMGAFGPEGDITIQVLKIRFTAGESQGQELQFEHTAYNESMRVKAGDSVTLHVTTTADGEQVYQISGFVRRNAIYAFTLVFILAAVLVGGRKTMRALFGLVLSIVGIYAFLLPAVLDGRDPLAATLFYTVIVSLIVIPVTLGFSRKSAVALIGILGGCLCALFMAMLFGEFIHLTGIEDEDSFLLLSELGEGFNYRGILFAGVLISALGAVNDVAISIASSMQEISAADTRISRKRLIHSGMNVGRDILGSMIDTLVLAYIGAALPTTLLFLARDLPIQQILNLDFIATEIMRAIAGSIGLVIAIPITVFTGSIIFTRRQS